MKRCPECQFLYDNDSTQCDMDGTPLRYTVKLPTLPGLAQSIWDKWTIALLVAVVMVTVLAILYRATPRAYTSSAAGQTESVKSRRPAVNQSPPSADSAAPPESTATQSATDDFRDPFETPSTTTAMKAPKSRRGLLATDEKQPTPAPVIHVQAAENQRVLNASSTTAESSRTQMTTGETSAIGTSGQKPAASATSTSIHPTPPAAATSKTTPPIQTKDSGFKSILKKASKILKKPFGEN